MTEVCYWIFCFVPLETTTTIKIFGFSEFLSAVALLVVIYTTADVRYKFRIAITPGPIYLSTFCLIAVIGIQTLFTEMWIAEKLWVPRTVWLNYPRLQALFGTLFLFTFLTWMYYAFIRPPVFGRRNSLRYLQEIYRYILRGSDEELRVVAHELARSAEALIRYSDEQYLRRISRNEPLKKIDKNKIKRTVWNDANQILLAIANRRFCKSMVSSSPVTAQALFEEMASQQVYPNQIGPFSKNFASEAFSQLSSFIYDETEEGYTSGLMGYMKPVSQAVFGNYKLIRALEGMDASPLDVHFSELYTWKAKQWEAYCRVTLLTLKDCMKNGYSDSPRAVNQALANMRHAIHDLYQLNDTDSAGVTERLGIICQFVRDALSLISECEHPPKQLSRIAIQKNQRNIYDHLASLLFDIISSASSIKTTGFNTWHIHHNIVWNTIYGHFEKGIAFTIVRRKVSRLLYDEIKDGVRMLNYKNAKILGYCLHVFGMTLGPKSKSDYERDSYAIRKVVLDWTKKNYLLMRAKNHEIADEVLIGSVSFDRKKSLLIKTYGKGLNLTPSQSIMKLEP